MTKLIPSTDKHPVYIDSNGNPLSFGKLFYYKIGTNEPKTVYTDGDRNIAASNPQILDNSGRTVTQIFLGDGQYTVVAYRFTGTDPNTAEPSDWAVDNQWDEEGGEIPSLAPFVSTIETIADLRNVAPSETTNAEVLGYYAAGDMFVRNYHWDATSTDYDNGGTIIKNPLYSIGAWVLDVDGDTLDVRIFGILPGRSDTYNSQLTAINSAAIVNSSSNPRTIYFPSGIYRFVSGTNTIQTKVIISKGVYFNCVTSGGTFTMDLNADYEIYHTDNIQGSASVGASRFRFTNPTCFNEVNVRWFGAKLDGTTDDGIAFGWTIANTTSNSYTFLIDGPMKYTSSINRSIYNNIHFTKNGNLNNVGSGSITFRPTCDIINETNNGGSGGYQRRYGVLSATYWQRFIFDTHYIRASWFLDNTGVEKTVALNAVIGGIGAEGKPTFIFDAKSNYFNGGVAITASNKFNFQYENGQLSNESPSNVVYLPNFDGADGSANIITTAGFGIGGVTTKYAWFIPASPSDNQYSDGFVAALTCAIGGNGLLDMCNKTCRFNKSTYTISASVMAQKLKIFNGTIKCTASGTNVLYLNNVIPLTNLILSDLIVTGGDCTLLRIRGASLIESVYIENTSFDTNSTSNTAIVIEGAGKVTGYMRITSSFFKCRNLLNSGSIFRLIINGNDFECDADVYNEKPVISNNYIKGSGVGKWRVRCLWSAMITGNRFQECDLYCPDNGGGIDHVITGNQFESTDTKWSRIMFEATTANTKFMGACVTGNSWTGTINTQFMAINCTTAGGSYDSGAVRIDYSGTRFTYRSNHTLLITSNTCSTHLIKVPMTKGTLYMNSPFTDGWGATEKIVNVDGYKRSVFTTNLHERMFRIPNSTYNVLGTVSVATDYIGTSSGDASNPYWSDPRAIDVDYRTDGKFIFAIHWTKNQNPYPTNLIVNFEMYAFATIGTAI